MTRYIRTKKRTLYPRRSRKKRTPRSQSRKKRTLYPRRSRKKRTLYPRRSRKKRTPRSRRMRGGAETDSEEESEEETCACAATIIQKYIRGWDIRNRWVWSLGERIRKEGSASRRADDTQRAKINETRQKYGLDQY